MNKYRYWLLILLIGSLTRIFIIKSSNCLSISNSANYTDTNKLAGDKESIPAEIRKLQSAYPDFISKAGKNSIFWKDGTEMIYDIPVSAKDTTFEFLLNNADLKDQMRMKYPKGSEYTVPLKNFDPGRIRHEAFYMKMYGNTQSVVTKNLVTIIWLPKTVARKLLITKVNNVNKKLIAISEELEKHPELLKYIDNPGGTFYWRKIAGTERLSMHSFGIAIDINVKYSDYWQWDANKNAGNLSYKNEIPMKIVKIFERHGFIWGGKWYHYDTMHFEYRPELLL